MCKYMLLVHFIFVCCIPKVTNVLDKNFLKNFKPNVLLLIKTRDAEINENEV